MNIIKRMQTAGIQIITDGNKVKIRAPANAPAELLAEVKKNAETLRKCCLPPAPATEPTFTPAEVRFLSDFYCSRPRPERLAMHKRSLYLRADRGWPWDVCETQAQREAYTAAGKPDDFTLATDGLNNRLTHQ